MIPVQFITHSTTQIGYEESALVALRGGCRWIQLRMKGATDEDVEPIALRLKQACKDVGATFILDDRVELCRKIEADGVHLGKQDMPIAKAREYLGHQYIIGGTANTADDIIRLKRASADYVGCGPYRFTTTKEKLSPIIGLDGYHRIMQTLQEQEVRIPVCAIGGITLADVLPLIDAGVQGIAVSGAVLRAEEPEKMMRRFLLSDEQ